MRKKRVSLVWVWLMCALPAACWGRAKDLSGILADGTWLFNLEDNDVMRARHKHAEGSVGRGLVSPDGARVLFAVSLGSGTAKRTDLRVIDRERRNEKVLMAREDAEYAFDWSPDSRFVAAVGSGHPHEIAIVSPASMEYWAVEPRNEKMKRVDAVRWRRDGRGVLLKGADASGKDGFYAVDFGMKEIRLLCEPPENEEAVLSPDEKQVLYLPKHERNMYVMDVETNATRRLWKTGFEERFVMWSPDMKWVYYQVDEMPPDRQWAYFARNLSTGKRVKLQILHFSTGLTWWQPPAKPPVECEAIVRETLGPGRTLENGQPH
ncbi:MAG: hypothetical protein HY548_05830 [Elusimicrobia bacterium]|nr:hypothetical protein [Elusimicrobiota bacterium]